MSAAAVIDSLEFARGEQELRGSLSVASLKRLEDVLFDSQGTLEYTVRGSRDERNRPLLVLEVTGALNLQCQRCLGRLEHDVRIASTLLLAPRGAPQDESDDPEGPDAIEASDGLDVGELVEDEVLLSLPLAPRHPEGTCESRLPREGAHGEPRNAFAKLASLKRSNSR
ncbi:MAG TPA: YceD family protein [Burkholderiales bacterium]|nr:YceD family protein [Burkholderiales bacterium]